MIDAVAYVDRGALVIEAADDYRSLETRSAHALELGDDVGLYYLLCGSRLVWARPFDAWRAWRWIPDDPDDPKPREGRYELTADGYHVGHVEALALLGLFGNETENLVARWFDESKNNGDLSREIRIETDGFVVATLSASPYVVADVVEWAGPADYNVDGSIDVFDFLAFQNGFLDGDLRVDFDRDGRLTLFDFLRFFDATTQDDR